MSQGQSSGIQAATEFDLTDKAGALAQRPIHELVWFYNRNPRRTPIKFDKDLDGLAKSFLRRRWDVSLGIVICVNLSEEDVELANFERKHQWGLLRAEAKTGAMEAMHSLRAFETLYCKYPGTEDAELHLVDETCLEAIICYRRSKALLRGAFIVSSKITKQADSEYLKEEIPEVFPEILIPTQTFVGLTDEEREILQLRENEGKTDGAVPLTDLDRLYSARKLYTGSMPQNKFRRIFKDGTGQKLFGLFKADSEYPMSNLVERVRAGLGFTWDGVEAKPKNKIEGTWVYSGPDCPVPLTKLDQVTLNQFANKTVKDYPATTGGLESYIKDKVFAKGTAAKADKAMTVADLKTAKGRTTLLVNKVAWEAVLSNNKAEINDFETKPECKNVMNAAFLLVKYGHGDEAAEALLPLMEKYGEAMRASEDAAEAAEAAKAEAVVEGDKVVSEISGTDFHAPKTVVEQASAPVETPVEETEPEPAAHGTDEHASDEEVSDSKSRRGRRRS